MATQGSKPSALGLSCIFCSCYVSDFAARMNLLRNVHVGLEDPSDQEMKIEARGNYDYWHYCCDSQDDRGWGCGYRTLQTLCSWITHQMETHITSNSGGTAIHINKQEDPSFGKLMSGACEGGNALGITVIQSVDDGASEDFQIEVINSCDFSVQSALRCDGTNTSTLCQVTSSNTDDIEVAETGAINPHVLAANDTVYNTGGCTIKGVKTKVIFSEHTGETQVHQKVPSIPEIQKALVEMLDKPPSFVGSKQWIGSYEVCLCIDYFYGVPCKILHVNQGSELINHLTTLCDHFTHFGSPVMMGGDTDNSSKGIVGVCKDPPALLVVDPHYVGVTVSKSSLQSAGWVKWVLLEDFHKTSFYNLCMPQLLVKSD